MSSPIRRPVDLFIMQEHERSVGSPPDIDFREVAVKVDRMLDRRQRVFWPVTAGSLMSDAKDFVVEAFFCHGAVLPYRNG